MTMQRVAAILLCLFLGVTESAASSDWFWTEAASPRLSAARPTRLAPLGEQALRRDAGLRGLLPVARRTFAAYREAFEAASRAGDVSLPFLLALVVVESGGDPKAVSPKGAMGLGQLMPETARRFGVDDPFAPGPNLASAARYLDILLDRYGQDAVLALAAYNAGEGAVQRWRGVPRFDETRAYIPRVLGLWAALRRSCPRLPSHPRHPCPLG
jgi:soluble lytic murein transglycosylase-like protein